MKKLLLIETLLTMGFTLMAEDPAETYKNPIVNYSLPDPNVIRIGDGYSYLYATGDVRSLPTHCSKDLIERGSVDTAFTDRTRLTFESEGNLWASDINKIGDKYVLHYSMSCWGGEWTCEIGIVTTDKPEGPFVDHGIMFRGSEIGVQNSIDPSYIEDREWKYMSWGSFRGIYGIELTANGLKVKSGADREQAAGTAYEGTYIHKKNGYYHLFASTRTYCGGLRGTYQTVAGRSSSLWGSYLGRQGRSMLNNNHVALIHNNKSLIGTGHSMELITDKADNDWILYRGANASNPYGEILLLDRADQKRGQPVVKSGSAPTESPKPRFQSDFSLGIDRRD